MAIGPHVRLVPDLGRQDEKVEFLTKVRVIKYSLLSGSATYLVSSIATSAIPLALLPVLTRFLTPVEYGQVAMFQLLIAGFTAFAGLNVQGAASRRFFDADAGNAEIGSFIGSCVQILLASTLALSAVALLFLHPLSTWLGIQPGWVPLAILASAAGVALTLRLGQWQVRGEAVKYGVFQVSMAAVNMLLSLTLVVGLLLGSSGRIYAQSSAMLVFGALGLYLLSRDDLLFFWRWNSANIREALRFGVPLIPHVVGLFLLGALDRLVINSELGLGAAGIYMVAVQLMMALALLTDAVNKAFVPWLFERLARDEADEKRQVVSLTYVYCGALLAAAGLAFLFGPWLVTLIAGERYAAAGQVVGWLALGEAFGGMYLMVTNYIFFSKRTALLSLATVGAALLHMGLLLVLTRAIGLQGAAIAYAISMLVRFLLTWRIAQVCHPMPWFGRSFW